MDWIFVLLTCLLALVWGVRALRNKRMNQQLPRQTMQAEVVRLCLENPAGYFGRGRNTRYAAVFRLENGEEMMLSLPAQAFDRLMEGDKGELAWRGWQFLFFSKKDEDLPV